MIAPGFRSRAFHVPLRRRLGVIVLGLAIVGVLTAIDVANSPNGPVAGTFVLGPFVVAMLAGALDTLLVAVVAVALAFASAAWDQNFGSGPYYLRASVVVIGSGLAIITARTRARVGRDSTRFSLLSDLADVADGRLPLSETAARVCELLVPGFADICMLDVVHGEILRRLTVKAWGADASEREARLLARGVSNVETPGSGMAVATDESVLLDSVPDEVLRRGAQDEEDLALLRSLRMRSLVVVPLHARGRILGALSLILSQQSQRRYQPEDLRFVQVLSGRVALALDNAGLFTELQSMESQLTTALGSLTEAVTVQNPQGGLIYANEAAAQLLGYASASQMLATPQGEIYERFESFREDGSPLQFADLPGRQVAAGEEPRPLTVRVVDKETGRQSWRLTKASGVRDSSGRLTMVVNVISDITAGKRAEFAQRLLAQAGDVLGSSMELSDTLQQVANLCVPGLSDWCTVSIPNEHAELRAVAVAHSDPRKVALAREAAERYPSSLDSPGGAARVFREAKPEWVNYITDEMLVASAQDEEHLRTLRSLSLGAVLMLPITAGGRSVGVLSLISAESGRRFGDDDIGLAQELARRAGVAVENARLYTERSTIARTLQASLLPDELPVLPDWRSATLYRPHGDESDVGGDFYQAVRLKDAWLLMVGDVTGRGAPAAALTAFMRHTLRAAARMSGSAVVALDELNRELVNRPDLSLCTAVCVVLPDGDGPAEIISAGHPLPVLLRDGGAREVGAFGPMLGAYGDERWKPMPVDVRPGDVLVLYSDGVLDTVGPGGRFEAGRLQRALAGAHGAQDAVGRLDRALSEFQVGDQEDDIAVLAVERLGTPSPLDQPDPGAGRPRLSRSYPAVSETVPQARRAVTEWAASSAGLTGESLDAVRLAVSEAVTNVVRHAYRDAPGQVHISAQLAPGELWITVTDDGVGHQSPTVQPGLGVGLLVMADAADEFAISERPEGGTEAQMRFALDGR